MASISSSSTSSYKYDVFLSSTGKFAPCPFADHLCAALRTARIATFKNDADAPEIEIERVITESRTFIIVISLYFANSRRILNELVLILEQYKKHDSFIFPVFYRVDPSDVRTQHGYFMTVDPGWTAEEVKRWKAALIEVADIKGCLVTSDTHEVTIIKDIVKEIYNRLDIDMGGRTIGKLFVSSKEIAKGSNGTVVYEGLYESRKVAVKRLVKEHHEVAFREIQNLIESDQHQNIVRWYDTEYTDDFVYIALERCDCTLYDLIEKKMYSESFQLMTPNGYPSSVLLKLMRDTCIGLEHLHKLMIIHRDLKPHNVLIVRGESPCVKLADMGISRPLVGEASSLGPHATVSGTSGWRPPEQVLSGQSQTQAIDMFSLGCVLFFCLTGGKHLFGDSPYERELNVINNNKVNLHLVEGIPEGKDLISKMVNPKPELRPKASEVLLHPLFWNSETRMSFIRDTSDWVDSESRRQRHGSAALTALENEGCAAFNGTWKIEMEPAFISHMERKRNYNYNVVQDLLRIIRNTMSHYHELPQNFKNLLGSKPEGVDDYFRTKFPKLLMAVYDVMYDHCKQEKWFCKYLES